jgi:hypothetical protein
MSSMEDKIPSSNPPQMEEQQVPPMDPSMFTPEGVEAMKARARELAIQQHFAQRAAQQMEQPAPPRPIPQMPQAPAPTPNIVYLRRNLTIAEMLVVLAIAIGLVTGSQLAWNFSTDILSRIEIREK